MTNINGYRQTSLAGIITDNIKTFTSVNKRKPASAAKKGETAMKKTYKIDVDCANCANKMEEAANKTPGVKEAVVNFMALKMKVEFEDGADIDGVMQKVVENCKIVEDDCQIYL